MGDSGVKPDARTPDEGAMLAFVEGELSLSDEVAFRRGLRHAPEVLVRLEAMRRDKALLRASMLRQPIVPGGLSLSVDEAIDRAALLSVSGAGDGSRAGAYAAPIGEPRLSTRVVESPWRVFSRPPVRAAMAMAATVAIVAGGVVLVSRLTPGAGVPGGSGAGSGVLAQGESGSESAGGEGGVEGLIASSDVERGVEAGGGAAGDEGVDAQGEAESRVASAASGTPDVAPGALPVQGPSVPVDDPVVGAPGAAFPVASTRLVPGGVARRDVMALAEQHRLALRVSADEPMRVIAALEAAASGETPSGWRVVGDAPATLASSLGVTIEPVDETSGGDGPAWGVPGSGGSGLDEPGFDPEGAPDGPMGEPGSVDGGREGDVVLPTGVLPDDAWLLRETENALAVYLAEVDMSEEGLAALDRDLRRAGRGAGTRAGFAALEDPLDRVIGRRDLLAPAGDVLWWHHPPREWSRRTLVPVVVERK